MSAASPVDDPAVLPVEWRDAYADLAADWIRERGTVPPSFEALAQWAAEPLDIPLDQVTAWLGGQGPNPYPCSDSD